MLLSVVVPVFNSAHALDELHDRVNNTLGSPGGVDSWELILVNDGSEDRSWERIVSLSRAHPEVRGVDLTRNWGQHNALLAGIHMARHEVIVTLDDDLQNPPEEIPKLLGALEPDLDVVYGVPIATRQPPHRRVGGRALRAILRALTRSRAVSLSTGFRALRSSLAHELPVAGGRHVALDSLLRCRTDRFGSTPVEHRPRRVGRSNYTPLMLARHALTAIATDLRPKARETRRDPSYEVRAVTQPQLDHAQR